MRNVTSFSDAGVARARAVIRAGDWQPAEAIDRVTLDHDARHRRRFHYVGEGGTAFLLDLARATVLGDGDALLLDDGRMVAVHAAAEPLIEVIAADPNTLMRIAWHVGNRHLPAELRAGAIRLRDDHVIAAMLRGLGADVRQIRAPFSPEHGAYAADAHGHHHDH